MDRHPHYSAEVWRRFRAPGHAGVLNGGISGEARTPASNAVLQLQLQLAEGRIQAARFRALGCPSTVAAADWMCEWLEGRSPAEAGEFRAARLVRALELVPVRRHCAVLAEDALRITLGNMQSNE